ncbi:MAG: biopolymer transporter ExbD [Casimicrobiaceae bacterium]
MAKRKGPSVKEDVTANLIPMIDIMFLLLLFFMLGADMSQRERAELILPKADQVKEEPKEKTEGEIRTTINVAHRSEGAGFHCAIVAAHGVCREPDHWYVTIRSQAYTIDTIKDQIKAEADAALEPDIDPAAGKRLSGRKVIIRADQFAPYGMVQKLIEMCGQAGMYKIEVGAAKPTKA